MTADPRPANTDQFVLGEGPVWDHYRDRLLWVDILSGSVLEGAVDATGIRTTSRREFGESVGAVAFTETGALVVAAVDRLVIERDGSRVDGPRVLPPGSGRRLNDAAVDPAGRLVVGTLCLAGDSACEELARVEQDGAITTLDDDLTLSNGIAWSPDGTRMYSVDTYRRVVYRRDYDPATGATGERRVHLRIDAGFPDGIAIDADENLWVAIWGGGQVRSFAPDGRPLNTLHVPAPHVSSIGFAGHDLDTLVITTATADLTETQRHDFPQSGRLFVAETDVPGLPTPAWSGCPTF